MTEKQKRLAIIGGTVILAVLLLLFFRRNGATGTVTSDAAPYYELPAVYGPNLGPIYYDDPPFNFTIPGLDLSGPDLSMIGSCCSDCMQSSAQPMAPSYGDAIVINEGNSGPNVFNYYGQQQTYYSPGVYGEGYTGR